MLLLATSIIVLINMGLGFTVLLRNYKNSSNFIFFLITLVFSILAFVNYVSIVVTEPGAILFWARLVIVIAASHTLLLVVFSSIFPRKNISMNKFLLPYFISYIVISVISFTPLVFNKMDIYNQNITVIPGKLIPLYGAWVVLSVIIAFYLLFKKYRHPRGDLEKLQLKFIIAGTIITYLLLFIMNFIVVNVFKYTEIVKLTPFFTLPFIYFTAYAIVRHRFMDIRMIIARSVAFAILLALIAIFYDFSTIWLEKIIFPDSGGNLSARQIVFRILLTLFVIFSFQPLKKFITKKTDRVFFKQSYDPDQLLDTLAHTMSSSIVLIELLYKVLNILTNEMKVSRGFFVILKDSETIDTTQGVGYKKSPGVNVKEIEALVKDGVCIYDELDEGSQVKRILRKRDASMAIPLKSNNKVAGILFLGEKSSGDMYSAQDIKIFEILGPEVAVAIENAKSYEEIQKFNAVLRSEVKKATTDLERANQNLRELDKAKDEFITMASHQLRTPLTAIKGYLSMLLEGDAGEIKVGQYEFVEEAYSGATRMVALINDLLNVSRMETGRFFLEPTDFELTRLINEEIKQLEKTAKDKGLEVEFTKKGRGDIKLCADEMKVRQVVMNFIDNAIYYTINGKIKVRVSQDKESAYFEVTDNGIGVPKEQQKHLFTKFYRAENARRTRPDGTGLGLFMAKKVIEEHGGEIIFHSEEGRGSTFGFKLPKNANIRRSAVSAATKNVPAETRVADAPQAEKEEVLKYEPEEATVA